MPSGTEMDILRFIDTQGGETRMGAIKRLMACYASSYVETICGSLGRHDFIDWFGNGVVKMTEKGWKAVGKVPPEEEGLRKWLDRPKEPPEEKYKRWMGVTTPAATLIVPEKKKRSRRAPARVK